MTQVTTCHPELGSGSQNGRVDFSLPMEQMSGGQEGRLVSECKFFLT